MRKAGVRRHQAVFEYFGASSPLTRNATGEIVESWATAFTMPADFQILGSREFPAHHKTYADATARFVMDYRSELLGPRATEKYQIRFNGLVWNISPPSYGGTMREMTIEVVQKVEPE